MENYFHFCVVLKEITYINVTYEIPRDKKCPYNVITILYDHFIFLLNKITSE